MIRYGRSLLFPPAALATVWTATLLTIWLCGDLYFPLTVAAHEIVFTGVLLFSLGGFCAGAIPLFLRHPLADVSPQRRRQIDRSLNLALVVFLLNLPLSFWFFQDLSSTIAPRASLWKQIRIASSKANVSGQGDISIESFLLPFFTIVALIGVWEYTQTRTRGPRTLILLVLAAAYQLLNGARSEVLLLLVSSIVLVWLSKGAMPVRLLAGTCLVFLLVFAAGQISMSKYGADPEATLAGNLPAVAEGIGTYWLGGIIAFDQNRQNPELPYGWDLGKFAKRIANRLGANYSERDRNLEYTKISPSQITNVYTVFLPFYMDHGGMYGVAGLMFLMGFISVYVYRSALQGSCWAVFTLGAVTYATVMTIFSEEYFAQIMFWVKAGVLSTLVYCAPAITATAMRAVGTEPEPLAAGEAGPCA